MTADELLNTKSVRRAKPKNALEGAIKIAIRDAEIHGTKIAVKNNGKIEELTPDEMRDRVKSGQY